MKRVNNLTVAVLAAMAVSAVFGAAGASAFVAGLWYEEGELKGEYSPTTISAEQTPTGKPKFTFPGKGEAKCETSKFHSTWYNPSNLVYLEGGLGGEGAYDGCSALGFSTASVAMNGCAHRLNAYKGFKPTVDIVCPAGKSIEIAVLKGWEGARYCTIAIPAQTGLAYATLTNDGYHTTVTDSMSLVGLRYRFEKPAGGITCSSGEWTDGTYTNTIVLKGSY